jgi:hypothetical protein
MMRSDHAWIFFHRAAVACIGNADTAAPGGLTRGHCCGTIARAVNFLQDGSDSTGCNSMRNFAVLTAMLLALSAMAAPASAKGWLKGAVVGGVAGHYAAHHGVLGAAAGCLVGRHYAHKHARVQQHGADTGRF